MCIKSLTQKTLESSRLCHVTMLRSAKSLINLSSPNYPICVTNLICNLCHNFFNSYF